MQMVPMVVVRSVTVNMERAVFDSYVQVLSRKTGDCQCNPKPLWECVVSRQDLKVVGRTTARSRLRRSIAAGGSNTNPKAAVKTCHGRSDIEPLLSHPLM